MGDSAEFEKLTELEARLTAALDRISAGLGSQRAPQAPGAEDGTLAEAQEARAEAETRAAEMTERVDALEARLAETQDALADAQRELTEVRADASPGIDATALTALEGKLAEAEAKRGAAEADLAGRNAELDEMRVALKTAQEELDAARAEAAGGEEAAQTIAVLKRRVERARAERNEARLACDAARDLADELREESGQDPDKRILELRRDLRVTRMRAEDLAAQLSLAQSGAVLDAETLDQGLRTEVEALRQLREVEAAELGRIMKELEAGLDTAKEVGHA